VYHNDSMSGGDFYKLAGNRVIFMTEMMVMLSGTKESHRVRKE